MEPKAYNRVVETCSDRLYRFAYRLSRDADTAADLVQDSFLKLWEYGSDVEDPAAFLYTVLYRVFADAVRRGRLRTHYGQMAQTGPTVDFDRAIERMEWRDYMAEAMAVLPEVQRAVLLLRDYEGYSYSEIGGMTGLSESQVKVYLFRARVKMKTLLQHRK